VRSRAALVTDADLAVDGCVPEVLVVTELVDEHVERLDRTAEGGPIE